MTLQNVKWRSRLVGLSNPKTRMCQFCLKCLKTQMRYSHQFSSTRRRDTQIFLHVLVTTRLIPSRLTSTRTSASVSRHSNHLSSHRSYIGGVKSDSSHFNLDNPRVMAKVRNCEDVLGYKFNDLSLCRRALFVKYAKASGTKRLALLGDTISRAALCEHWYESGLSGSEFTGTDGSIIPN